MAVGQPAYQSTTDTSTTGLTLSAKLAVDGNADTNYAHGHCSRTSPTDPDDWLVVDLGKWFVVTSVAVTNRGDCCGEFFCH